MGRFIVKVLLVLSIFFIGILIGIQEANNGMKKMRGYDDPGLMSAFSIEEKGAGEYETTVLGQTNTNNLEEKKQKLEQIKTFNLFTDIAKKISRFFTDLFAKIVPD